MLPIQSVLLPSSSRGKWWRKICWMARKLAWTNQAWSDYLCWQRQDQKTLKRINKLTEATIRLSFEGIGKPEPLRKNLAGFWLRRIDDTNRLVYAADDEYLTIIACRYCYSDRYSPDLCRFWELNLSIRETANCKA